MNLTEWSKKIHANAKAKGWWDEERSVDDNIALCHSKLSKALEHYRDGHTADEVWLQCPGECGDRYAIGLTSEGYDSWARNLPPFVGNAAVDAQSCCYLSKREYLKPDGVPIEIADCVIRVLDWAGKEGFKLELGVYAAPKSLGWALCRMHDALSTAWKRGGQVRSFEGYTERDIELSWLITVAHAYLASIGHDLETLIELKHAYNVTRPHRHGGKVL